MKHRMECRLHGPTEQDPGAVDSAVTSEIIESRYEMLVVETIARISRAYYVRQKPIKAFCRELTSKRSACALLRDLSGLRER